MIYITGTGVAFSTAVRGGVRYTALLAIQICGCPHSTMGHGHFSLWTPIPECMCTGQQLSAAHTTVFGCRESPLTRPSSLPTIDSLTAHPRVHVHRPTAVCSSHNCLWPQRIPLNTSLISPHNRFTYSPSQSACTQTNSCLWLTQACLGALGIPLNTSLISPHKYIPLCIV